MALFSGKFSLNPSVWWEALKRFCRLMYLRLIRIQATPHTIAIGMAAGVFIGLLPVLPFQTVLALGLAFIVRGSKIAAALGTWVSNPLNWVPLYLLFYHIGKAILPFDVPPFNPSQLELEQMIEAGWKLVAAMMAGGLIIAIPSAIIAYIATYKGVALYRERKEARRKAKWQERRAAGV